MDRAATRRPVAAAVLVAALCLFGCASPGSLSSSAADRAQFEKRTGADEGKARQFLTDLSSQPFPSREAYLNAHPDDVRNLSKIPDPELQSKFRTLMTNHP